VAGVRKALRATRREKKRREGMSMGENREEIIMKQLNLSFRSESKINFLI
jgi:hypothetical protein